MRKAGKPPKFPVWKPRVFHLVVHFLRNGVAQTVPVAEASGFADEEVLDGPGRPQDADRLLLSAQVTVVFPVSSSAARKSAIPCCCRRSPPPRRCWRSWPPRR